METPDVTDYIRVKKSQIHLFEKTPFYYQTGTGVYALYKKKGDRLDEDRLKKVRYPDLYIRESDRTEAVKELMVSLNRDLEEKIKAGQLKDVRESLSVIVEEALTPGQESAMETLPDTIDLLLGRYNKDHKAMDYLSKIAVNSPLMVEHTVNVTALTLQYCFFHKFPETDTRRMGISALLHDLGCAQIDITLIETTKRLTDKQYKIYTTHPELGHDTIISDTEFDVAIPTVALEHHERIDGSGYPNGTRMITTYSQLIGLIDSYEALTYHSKKFRKAKKPFDTLSLIKDEVLKGKFSKEIFKDFTSCLTR